MQDPRTIDAIAQAVSQKSGFRLRPLHEAQFGPVLGAKSFVLDNGLTMVLAEDHRAPIFAYQTWFKVGSKDEDPSLTGIAHLFEHLMFKGTTRFASGTFDHEMGRRGAQTNAATWVDWTYYTQALAARGDNLEAVITFESDRMVNLVVDTDTFKSELEVVKNERRMSVDDAVGGAMSEALMAQCFTAHPYRWPTIGSMAHLEAATLDDLRAFYRAYYAPNNATVVLVGALEPVAALTAVAKAYGPLPAQPVPSRQHPVEPRQAEARLKVLKRPVLSPQVVMGFHGPAQGTADHYAMEMLADILTEGDTGRLHRRLVTQERLASEISGFVTPFAEPGLFELHMNLNRDADPHRCVAIVHEELAQVSRGLTDQEMAKARYGLELSVYDGLKDVEGMAEALGHAQTNTGDFRAAFEAPGLYAAMDAEQLIACSTRYLRPDNVSVVMALPGKEAP
jgi:zinc protease